MGSISRKSFHSTLHAKNHLIRIPQAKGPILIHINYSGQVICTPGR
jgi:hypothetical protein